VTTVPLAPVRRWIGRTQSAHRDRGETLGSIYVGVLAVAIIGGMLHERIAAVFWPARPDLPAAAVVALIVVCAGLLHRGLRRFGPLALSRPAASFLLTAPVSRRRLLLPSLRLTTLAWPPRPPARSPRWRSSATARRAACRPTRSHCSPPTARRSGWPCCSSRSPPRPARSRPGRAYAGRPRWTGWSPR